MKLSTRERLFVGIFLVALVWGAYNYRYLWITDRPPTSAPGISERLPTSTGAPTAAMRPTTTSRAASDVGSTGTYEPPPWSDDPFNRPWRRGTGVTVDRRQTRG